MLKTFGIGLCILLAVIFLAALSPSSPPGPRYSHDPRTNLCFAEFDREKDKEHVLVPCTPEVLHQTR